MYTDIINYNVIYNYTVFAYNLVGTSLTSYQLNVTISQAASSDASYSNEPISLRVGYPSVFTVNLKDDAGNTVLNPSLMILEIRDACAIQSGYECIRVQTTDSNYVPDLLNGFVYQIMINNLNGTMYTEFTPQLAGPYTFSVIQLQPSGVYANY